LSRGQIARSIKEEFLNPQEKKDSSKQKIRAQIFKLKFLAQIQAQNPGIKIQT